MTLTPILEAPFIIQLHLMAALPALIISPISIWGRRTRRTHKTLGYIWVVALAVLAISGLFIPSNGLAVIGHFGPIHLFSFYALWGIGCGVWFARCGRIDDHRSTMRATWMGSMGIAGLLSFIPGRTINEMVFGAPSDLGWGVIAAGLIALYFATRSHARPFARPVSAQDTI